MRKILKKTLLAISIVISFVACSDKQDANKSNFKTAINNYLDNKCINIGSTYMFPMSIEIDDSRKNKLDSMEKIGLIKSTKKQIEVESIFENKTKLVDGFIYELTDFGKNYRLGDRFFKLCVGKYKVIEIDNFTKPADMFGVKISHVSYKKEAINIPTWAYELVKEKSFENSSSLISKDIKNDKIVLILTNDGWIAEKEFKK